MREKHLYIIILHIENIQGSFLFLFLHLPQSFIFKSYSKYLLNWICFSLPMKSEPWLRTAWGRHISKAFTLSNNVIVAKYFIKQLSVMRKVLLLLAALVYLSSISSESSLKLLLCEVLFLFFCLQNLFSTSVFIIGHDSHSLILTTLQKTLNHTL